MKAVSFVLLTIVLASAACQSEQPAPPPAAGTGGSSASGSGGSRATGGANGTGGMPIVAGSGGASTGTGGAVTTGTDAGDVAAAGLPAALLGDWQWIGSDLGQSYSFKANGEYLYASRYQSPFACVAFKVLEVTELGLASASGGSITFTPTSGTRVETNCSGAKVDKPPMLAVETLKYQLLAGDGGAILRLGEGDKATDFTRP